MQTINRGKGGMRRKGGKSDCGFTYYKEVATAAGTTIAVTASHDNTGEMTMITATIGEIEVVHTDLQGIGPGEDSIREAMAPPHQTHVTAI